MGEAIDHLKVLFAKAFVQRHKRVTAEGDIVDVEAYWRQLPPSVRKTFKESMHAPTVQGGESHPFDAPDIRPLKDLAPGERAAFEAVQLQVGQRKAEALKAKVGDQDKRSAGYLKAGRGESKKPGMTCAICGLPLHPSLKKGQWVHSKRTDHSPKPIRKTKGTYLHHGREIPIEIESNEPKPKIEPTKLTKRQRALRGPRKSKSVRTISGGLPTLGKRR
jgi:hypothetical protein